MTERHIRNEYDMEMAQRFLSNCRPPFTMRITDGISRSLEQNKLQRLWLNEIAEQKDDQTAEDWRGYCKLRFGVPIMRAADPDFCEKYDRIIKPHSYEDKIEMMMEPLDFPVTRLMKTKQKTQYLDRVFQHFTLQGVVLTEPPA